MKKRTYKGKGTKGLFDGQFRKERLSEIGNPLESISKVIDFEMFRPLLEENLHNKERKNNAGARPYDPVLMFKIMILQRYYNLSDKQVEYQIVDRTSFRDFLGLASGDKVPDEKTVWAFREQMTRAGLVEKLFEGFNNFLENRGLMITEGQIVDASFVTAPRQRNSKEENEQIKNGQGGQLWNDKPNKKRHKDTDARWTKKNKDTFYGYKNHTKDNATTKLIKTYKVTDASVHDSQALGGLLDEEDAGQDLWGDSAYIGPEQEKTIAGHEMNNRVHERGSSGKPLNKAQQKSNKKKSKVRARVEHVFGFMEQSMNGLHVRSVGIVRATGIIGLINLTYNIFRYEQILRTCLGRASS